AWLTQQTGQQYRLPTEGEWEYAARAGTETKYWWGNEASHDYANYGAEDCCSGVAAGQDQWVYTSPIGSFAPNAFGLYDTSGNLWEWTCSEYDNSYNGKERQCLRQEDSSNNSLFVLRGGSWNVDAVGMRSSNRGRGQRSIRIRNFGARLSRIL
ncbi:MAG: formylglycine-generating enzyme family protein, partial [Candidatus Parabeggiatoa sp.]|nr:formylglycine-generating enzyme family protein [Candidatus Parabeggiatoa sp.]